MLLEASRISETVLKQTNSNSNKMGITAEAQALAEILGKYASIPESQERDRGTRREDISEPNIYSMVFTDEGHGSQLWSQLPTLLWY